jgi:hypothetical protein
MARAKGQDALRKQKEARQKKMLIGLAPILLILLVWQGPGMLRAFSGGSTPPPAAAPVTAPAEGASSTDPTAAAPPTAGGVPAETPAPAGAAATLPDTDDPDAAAQGQLVSFDRFVGKDPFKQQVVVTDDDGAGAAPVSGAGGSGPATSPPTTEAAGGGGGGGSGGGSGAGSGIDPPVDAPTSGTVDVNGERQEVFVGSTFPTIDPVFRIVSFGAKSARFELVTGAFSTGASTVTLKLRKRVTLISQPDGLRYVITLVALGDNAG